MITYNSTFIIKGKDYEAVVYEFNTTHDNGTATIAKRLGLSFGYTNYIIDFYLSLKKNYMGVVPIVKNYPKNIKNS